MLGRAEPDCRAGHTEDAPGRISTPFTAWRRQSADEGQAAPRQEAGMMKTVAEYLSLAFCEDARVGSSP
jgi:hypothetical protein